MTIELKLKGKKEEEEEEEEQVVIQEEDKYYMKGVKHLRESGITKVPSNYILPLPERPRDAPQGYGRLAAVRRQKLPLIDLGQLCAEDAGSRARILETLDRACREYGFFQVVNHGFNLEDMRKTIDVARRFFELPLEEREKYMSNDVRKPVRYGTSFNQMIDGVFYWRDFLKLMICHHDLDSVLPYWPSSPMDLREEITTYAKQINSLYLVLMTAVLDALGVNHTNLTEDFQKGSHLMVINYYPSCPEPELTLGMPPHSDYGLLTLLLQDEVAGLQVQYGSEWISVEPIPNSFVVDVGDHLEIFSNGRYKSALHRVTVNSSKPRISVASLHSLPYETVIGPAPELVDDENPRLFKDTDFASFLDFISSHELKDKNFLESRKLTGEDEEHSKSRAIKS